MTAAEVRALPVKEKFQIMEALWEDLRDRFEGSEIAESHKELLDARRERVESGDARLLAWDDVKGSIGRR